MRTPHRPPLVFLVPLAILIVLLVVPLAVLLGLAAGYGLGAAFLDPAFLASVLVTFAGAGLAAGLAALLGTPSAYALSRGLVGGRLGAVIEAVLLAPLTVPHVIAGIALLLTFSPLSPLYPLLGGLRIVDTFLGLTLAFFFVSSPLFVSGVKESLGKMDPRLELASRSLGAGPGETFRRVVVPGLRGPILESFLLTWARAVSEFGSIVILAYFLLGLPLLGTVLPASVFVFNAYQVGGLYVALGYAGALLVFSLIPLILLQAVKARPWRSASTA